MADLYEARSRLEGFAAELAARRATPDDVAELEASAHRFEALATDPGLDESEQVRSLMRANDEFHRRLMATGRAEQVRRLLAGAIDLPLVYRAFEIFGPAELARSATFHHLIVEAVRGREPERARRLMVEHVLQGRDAVVGRLGGQTGHETESPTERHSLR